MVANIMADNDDGTFGRLIMIDNDDNVG